MNTIRMGIARGTTAMQAVVITLPKYTPMKASLRRRQTRSGRTRPEASSPSRQENVRIVPGAVRTLRGFESTPFRELFNGHGEPQRELDEVPWPSVSSAIRLDIPGCRDFRRSQQAAISEVLR